MAVSQELAQEWLGDVYEAFDGEDGDYEYDDDEDYDDEFGAGVTIIEAEPAEPEPETDLAHDAYGDPLALVNAWEGALQDYKASPAAAKGAQEGPRADLRASLRAASLPGAVPPTDGTASDSGPEPA